MSFFEQDFLDFFIELAPNNHKDWFDLNRKRYETKVREPFAKFVRHIIEKMTLIDPIFKDLQAKDCIFRINRDVRFSKDKSPYKLMVSAVVAPNGKKSKAINGIYFEFGPEHVRVYGGIYEVDKDEIHLIREGIVKNLVSFNKLYSDKKFVALFGEIKGEKNKTLPKELKEAGEKENLLFNKQWYFYTEFPPETVLKENLDEILLNCFEVGKPVEVFFQNCLSASFKLN